MLKSICSSLLICMLLALGTSSSFAQGPEKQYNREIFFGSTLGNGFNPRLIYKKVNGKSATRFLLRFNSGARSSTREVGDNLLYTSEVFRNSNLDIAIGIGREWRTDIQKRFQVYAGGDIELLYGMGSDSRVRSLMIGNGSTVDVESRTTTSHAPGLALHAFGGLRFNVTDRVSFSAEAGPRLSGLVRLRNDDSQFINNQGTPDEEYINDQYSSTDYEINFRAIGPIYVQFAIHF